MPKTMVTESDLEMFRRTVHAFRGKITMTQMNKLFPKFSYRVLERAFQKIGVSLPTNDELVGWSGPAAAKFLFDAGWSIPRIRKALSWSHNKMTLSLNAASVPVRERHRRRSTSGHQITPDEARMIWSDMESASPGERFRESQRLAEEIGCASSTVREVWRFRSLRSKYLGDAPGEPTHVGRGLFTVQQAREIREQVEKFPRSQQASVIRDLVDDLNAEMPDLLIPIDQFDIRDAIRSLSLQHSGGRVRG